MFTGIFTKTKGQSERESLIAALRGNDLFGDLSENKIKKLVPAFRVKEFNGEQITCHCPDASHDSFVVVQGRVAVTRRKGEFEHTLELEDKGGIINVGLMTEGMSPYTGARALGQTTVLAIDTKKVASLAQEDPELGSILFKNVCSILSGQFEKQLDRLLN